MSLRQNDRLRKRHAKQFSYQSECHCAKTGSVLGCAVFKFSYQSECHCAKTVGDTLYTTFEFSYQSECHCAKTT